MESHFVKSSEETTHYHEMVGMTEKEWTDRQSKFQDLVRRDILTNSGLVAEWIVATSKTVEEAVLLAITCTQIVEDLKHKGKIKLGKRPDGDDDLPPDLPDGIAQALAEGRASMIKVGDAKTMVKLLKLLNKLKKGE